MRCSPSKMPWRCMAASLIICFHIVLLRLLHNGALPSSIIPLLEEEHSEKQQRQQPKQRTTAQKEKPIDTEDPIPSSIIPPSEEEHSEKQQQQPKQRTTAQNERPIDTTDPPSEEEEHSEKQQQQPKQRTTARNERPIDTTDPLPKLHFGFDTVFGDNMVLQRAPSKAAIYGFLGDCKQVKVLVFDNKDDLVRTYRNDDVMINATKQPFGPEWGTRPCSKENCPPYDLDPFNPWNAPLSSWKVLLDPTEAGGNYTIVAQCTAGTAGVESVTVTNVTFGDVWYCSGQSNMWLPMRFTYSRKETVKAILNNGKYHNIRIMSGRSNNLPYFGSPQANLSVFSPASYGMFGGSNPWQSALQAVESKFDNHPRLFLFGATCFYFAQRLVDLGLDDVPIGLANTAIGGQRIELYMNNSTINRCSHREGEDVPYWNSVRYAQQVLPFVDMTVKGWVWYQGENNMYGVKGNANANMGYSCELKELIHGWRRIWSEIDGTTHPLAPFGVVTLASSAASKPGDFDMGAMRHAQTVNHGILPNADLPNTFLAQAYDLDDEWGEPWKGPCVKKWRCCSDVNSGIKFNKTMCGGHADVCKPVCAVNDGTISMGGVHPRSKKQVGDRLGTAAFNTVYGGTNAFTGPTLEGCTILKDEGRLEIRFNSTLLRGDNLVLRDFPSRHRLPEGHPAVYAGGSQLYVQTDARRFCMEPTPCSGSPEKQCCAHWAGGTGNEINTTLHGDTWTMLNYSLSSNSSIHVDLSPLHGATPTAVRYAWGVINCCDYADKTLYVKHGCIENCPFMGSSNLPTNPFQAKIVGGECSCVAPQVCSSK